MRSSGTSTSSREIAAVSEPRRPSLWWIGWGWKPGWSVSTRKQARPRWPWSGSVWAKISASLAWLPIEIHILAPLITQPESVLARAGALVGGVGAGVGLGQAEAAQPLARAQLGQELLLLLLGAPAQDRRADERGLDRDHRPHRRAAAADLLDHEPVGHVVQPGAAVLARARSRRGSPERRSWPPARCRSARCDRCRARVGRSPCR